jgi:DNA ligase-1
VKGFADLFTALDQSTRTSVKVDALAAYFGTASEADKLWTIAILSGRRPKRTVTTTLLRAWAAEKAGIPLWLFEEAYPVVGDLAEAIALVLPEPIRRDDRALSDWIALIRGLAAVDEPSRKAAILTAWDGLGQTERLVFNKLITGGFRVGLSQKLMNKALSKATGVAEAELAHRLMGNWTPDSVSFESLVLTLNPEADLSKPYPFYLAHSLEDGPEALGAPENWQAEWKWDGIRGQVILRGGQHFVWSRGEELMTDRFPELAALRDFLPDGTVLDGELLAWDSAAETPLPFNALQKRIGRKTVSKKLLAEAPVILLAYDLLEAGGVDLRVEPLAKRRIMLGNLARAVPEDAPLRVAPAILFADWDALATVRAGSREARAEGLMIKRLASPYLAGRKKGDWWKWKVDPLSFDAVMIYAQAGHGRRATLFTDYTFAVWHEGALVPVTKAYSGLRDVEFKEITAWVKKNTTERFGPVRSVPGELVFEIAFEGIAESPRHKSGIALRFPRMVRWRRDKPASEADTLEGLRALL